MKNRILATGLTLVALAINANCRADMVTDWSANLDQTNRRR
jgi:hypothetical protein